MEVATLRHPGSVAIQSAPQHHYSDGLPTKFHCSSNRTRRPQRTWEPPSRGESAGLASRPDSADAEFAGLSRLPRSRADHVSTTRKPITEIAFDIGYESSQAFSKAFREGTGASASGLRKEPIRLEAVIRDLSRPPRQSPGKEVEVRLVSVSPFQVIASRHVGPEGGLFKAFGRLLEWAGKKGIAAELRGIYGIQGLPGGHWRQCQWFAQRTDPARSRDSRLVPPSETVARKGGRSPVGVSLTLPGDRLPPRGSRGRAFQGVWKAVGVGRKKGYCSGTSGHLRNPDR